ncbi:hypothetical protein WAI453_012674 [Rhynchosporium graminicola]
MDLPRNSYDEVAEDCCSAAENSRPCAAPTAPIICLCANRVRRWTGYRTAMGIWEGYFREVRNGWPFLERQGNLRIGDAALEAESISVSASFYNSIDTTFYPYEATPEAAEGRAPPQNNDTTLGLGQSVPSASGFVITADLDSARASYISEDGRLTLLREIDTIFRDMATNSSGSRATISQETLRLLPIISRTVIQYVDTNMKLQYESCVLL